MKSEQTIIDETRYWLETVVIKFNFCPFAKRELINNRIRFTSCKTSNIETVLEALILECEHLDSNTDTETSLLILPEAFESFDDYLDLLEMAQALIEAQDYEGIYQLASFHPNYLFEGNDETDPANYTNRSPYPMLHLIRETSLEAALQHYEQPELIPENNIKLAKKSGLQQMQSLLKNCYKNEDHSN